MANISQRVIFTAIPDGLHGDRAFLNIHVAPRLSLTSDVDPKTLVHFPAWQDWAGTINGAKIRVYVDGAEVGSRRLAEARSAVWTALFPVATRVQSHTFQDLRRSDVLTYPMADLGELIEDAYVHQAGEDGDALPAVSGLGRLAAFRPDQQLDRAALLALLNHTDEATQLRDPSLAIALLAAYHRPLENLRPMVARSDNPGDGHRNPGDGHLDAAYESAARVALPNEAELARQFDFHRIVAAMGQHPALMRSCGLVVPLELRRLDVPNDDFTVEVEVDWATEGVKTEPNICPRTLARNAAGDFRARPRNAGMLSGGWLKMDRDTFRLVTMDVDGAGLSLKNFAINLPRIGDERYDDEEFNADRVARVGMPRIRSAGLQLAQTRRDRAIKKLFEGSGKLNDDAMATGTAEVFAEDLIRGWRADIVDEESGRWQSLLRFDGRYELVNSGEVVSTDDEETMLRIAAGKAVDGSAPDLLKVSEALFAWSGWSLAAPQPGRAIMPDDKNHEDAPNTVPDGLPLAASPRAHPGSLPLLRFGRTYRARMRYADLSGGGVGWRIDGSGIDQTETPPYFFGRYEPVEAPALTLIDGDALPKDGESMGRAALRTRDDPADNTVSVRRNIVPAQVGIRFAELHGVLDRDARPDPSVYALLTERDGSFTEIAVPGLAFDPANPGVPLPAKTSFATGPEAAVPPYLYDPLAAGAALRIRGVPGIDPDKIWNIPFSGDAWDPAGESRWPNARSFSLRAIESGTTGWDPAQRTFTVVLKPAERARIELSALVPRRGLLLFKLLERLSAKADGVVAASRDSADTKRFKQARRLASQGRHWMFTPWRNVELVHAVQRPLIEPVYHRIGVIRSFGDVTAKITYATPIHCKSTVRIDTDASWIEIDDKSGDGPSVQSMATDAFSRPFARLDCPGNEARHLAGQHVFADTRARHVGYRMRATTRFREFMPLSVRANPDAIDRKGARVETWVPSSSPPAAPAIRYVVPTFGWWESGVPGSEQRNWREGGGLRIYLDRPWFSSGTNEMLAVLLPQVPDVGLKDHMRDFASQWGADPAWSGPKVKTVAPMRTAFPKRIDQGPVPYDFGDPAGPPDIPDGAAAGGSFPLTDLTPQGAPGNIRTEAVPHAVGYDRARQLWFCDIVIRPGKAYFPFVRLALARYQPHAISGCELSSVAMASFQQLSADRVAVVTPAGGPAGRLRRISIYGRLPSAGLALPKAGIVTVRLQRLKSAGDPDLDWRDTAPGVAPPEPGLAIGSDRITRTSSGFNLARSALSAAQREMLRQGSRLDDAQIARQLERFPDLFELLLPPLIHQEALLLPEHNGDRLRFLVTETETYRTETESGSTARAPIGRIIYAATIEA